MGRRGFIGVLLVALSLTSAPRAAFGFCRTTTCATKKVPDGCVRDTDGCWASGIPLFWEQQCVSYAVNRAGSPAMGLDYDAALAIVQKAFSVWPTAACADGSPSIAFTSRAGLTCDRVEFNPTGPNSNSIMFRDDNWTHDSTAIAVTTVAFSVKTGKILDADMEINSGGFPLTPFDLQFVIAHESGHFSGLDHSPRTDAVMFFQYASDNTADTQLTNDDIDAICTAYPPTRTVPVCDFEPDKGYAVDCGGDVQASCAVAPAAAAANRPDAGWLAAIAGLAAVAGQRWRVLRLRRRRAQDSQAGSRPRNA